MMNSYQCNVCGHIYKPEHGDPLHDIAPSTPFEDLPDEWLCPVCGVGKSSFRKLPLEEPNEINIEK